MSTQRKCGYCGKAETSYHKLRNCTDCYAVAYCGKTCQQQHRGKHKFYCQEIKSRRRDGSNHSMDVDRTPPQSNNARNSRWLEQRVMDGVDDNDDSDSDSSDGSMPALLQRRGSDESSSSDDDSSDDSSDDNPPMLINRGNEDTSSDDDSSFEDMPPLMNRGNDSDEESQANDSLPALNDKSIYDSSDDDSSIESEDSIDYEEKRRQEEEEKRRQEEKEAEEREMAIMKQVMEISDLAKSYGLALHKKLGIESDYSYFCRDNKNKHIRQGFLTDYDNSSVYELITLLFDDDSTRNDRNPALPPAIFTNQWSHYIEQEYTTPIFEEIMKQSNLHDESVQFLRSKANQIIDECCNGERKDDLLSFLKFGVKIESHALIEIFKILSHKRTGGEYNNELIKVIDENCELIFVNPKVEEQKIYKEATNKLGKRAWKQFGEFMKRSKLAKTPSAKKRKQKIVHITTKKEDDGNDKKKVAEVTKKDAKKKKDTFKSKFEDRIVKALAYYDDLLQKYISGEIDFSLDVKDKDEEKKDEEYINVDKERPASSKRITSQEAAEEIIRIEKMTTSEEDMEKEVKDLESNLDLSDFNLESEWTIEITENAHKWFRKHRKKQNYFCERVLARLKILSTGRFSYCLCKSLKTKKEGLQLYESKVDSGSRILWEVGTSFSPRRSSPGHSFCEHVIVVWDIVDDHDKLSDRIDLTIDRIEKSRARGAQSNVFAVLENGCEVPSLTSTSGITVPKVFAIKQDGKLRPATDSISEDKNRYYPPASHDPMQYNLIKFYQLNNDAIDIIMRDEEGKDEMNLPFTPGPKEFEIIHHQSKPKRSILLMGRSGTGKTTCLVFRMWATYMAYAGGENGEMHRPMQLFVTKNPILRDEVEKCFWNMGLAYKKLRNNQHDVHDESISKNDTQIIRQVERNPLFLTANVWLDMLDIELPGERFFTQKELEVRSRFRNAMDETVERGLQDIAQAKHDVEHEIVRKEFTFKTFVSNWNKINQRQKCDLDAAMVWREIYTFIKGSVNALKVNDPDRDIPTRRYLDIEEYLALPRKQSRLNPNQRQTVYELYKNYERVKKEGNYYDSMDIVYNLAGRVSKFLSRDINKNPFSKKGFLPIDSLFVDEVQDFTMAELYLLTQLSSDPNNLMFAGDTAQSITEGVAFRFTDVRQIFYQLFGGIEPDLLQLTHNYRSHSGILRLAACVVELLYFFFSDSLDRLPPDLGLLNGPKPIIMEVSSAFELGVLLLGSKREDSESRIEFGAHECIIVRNEDAKRKLAKEFDIDEEWILTVQESKGLEFDDVLLYNFFTDSIAEDIWRIVSNYKKKDAVEYNNSQISGIEMFEWKDLVDNVARELDFVHEKHKILETELKILYTAITRAKVNIFLVETSHDLSLPMFNYFQTRQVATKVLKSDTSNIPVFGKMSSSEDWRKRGESTLRAASGPDVANREGLLRMAAKCFEKAGDEKKYKNIMLFLNFLQFQENNVALVKDISNQPQQREKLYEMATHLLEAEDISFLDKASLCLIQSGDIEKVRGARIFALYARLSFAQRSLKGNTPMKLDRVEQTSFTYAAQYYEESYMEDQGDLLRREYLANAIENYLFSGSDEGWKRAKELLETNVNILKGTSSDIIHLFESLSENTIKDPLVYMTMKNMEPMKSQSLSDLLKKLKV